MTRYSDTFRDHALYPRNQGRLAQPDASGTASFSGLPPFVACDIVVRKGRLERLSFAAQGCGATIAACSMLSELAWDMHVDDARRLGLGDLMDALEGVPPDKLHSVEVALRALLDALDQLK